MYSHTYTKHCIKLLTPSNHIVQSYGCLQFSQFQKGRMYSTCATVSSVCCHRLIVFHCLRSIVHNVDHKNVPVFIGIFAVLSHLFITGLNAVILVSWSAGHVLLSSVFSVSVFPLLENPSTEAYWQDSDSTG